MGNLPFYEVAFAQKQVNDIFRIFGMEPNDYVGAFLWMVIVALAVMGLARIAFPPTPAGTYTNTASVYMRNYPATQNIINLDNAGTLRPYRTFYNPKPMSQVSLALNMPVTQLSSTTAPVSNGAAYSYPIEAEPDKKDVYTFDLSDQKSHLVKTGGRAFLVTFFSAEDLSKDEIDTNYKYNFGIDEK